MLHSLDRHDQKRYRHPLDISLLCQTLFMSHNNPPRGITNWTTNQHRPPRCSPLSPPPSPFSSLSFLLLSSLSSPLLSLLSPPSPLLSPPPPLLSLSGWWGERQWSYLRLSSISLSAVGSIWSYTEAKRHQRDKKSSRVQANVSPYLLHLRPQIGLCTVQLVTVRDNGSFHDRGRFNMIYQVVYSRSSCGINSIEAPSLPGLCMFVASNGICFYCKQQMLRRPRHREIFDW